MTVFKAYLKILKKNLGLVITYTIMLIIFGGFNMISNESTTVFSASKPDIAIINKDNSKFTDSLVKYLEDNSNIENPDNLEDALFYRELNYIIYIPEGYGENFLANTEKEIEVKSTGDYQSSLANMLLEKYLSTATTYRNASVSESEIIKNTEEILKRTTKVEVTSKLDSNALNRATTFFNFTNYAMLAGTILVCTLILVSFQETSIRKRTISSGMDYKKYNRILFISNSLFAITLWILYCILSVILIGDIMFTKHGLIYILNSFLFTFCALSIALLISTIIKNKDAVNGIVNVVALGSSFLCGAFVPMEWLPTSVLNIAHILPSYWFIKNNEIVKTLEVFNFETLKPILINALIVLAFTLLFTLISNIVSRNKRKLD